MDDEILQETFSVSQVAALIGKHPNTVRGYAQKFGQFLSDDATPAEGDERRFTEADVSVLLTIASHKSQRKQNAYIVGALARGEYIVDPDSAVDSTEAPIDEPQDERVSIDTPTTEVRALATLELLQQYAKPYMERVTELEGKLDATEEARRNAEVEAARLSGQLDAVYRRHWYQFWKPDKPAE